MSLVRAVTQASVDGRHIEKSSIDLNDDRKEKGQRGKNALGRPTVGGGTRMSRNVSLETVGQMCGVRDGDQEGRGGRMVVKSMIMVQQVGGIWQDEGMV